MKQFGRRLVLFISGISLLLCLVTALLWVKCSIVDRSVHWWGTASGYGLMLATNGDWSELSLWCSTDAPALHPLRPADINENAGFGAIGYYLGFRTPEDLGVGPSARPVTARGIEMPFWFLFLIFACLPATWCVGRAKESKRRSRHRQPRRGFSVLDPR